MHDNEEMFVVLDGKTFDSMRGGFQQPTASRRPVMTMACALPSRANQLNVTLVRHY